MSLVRGLVLLHLSATSLLLVVFVAVLACQRTADLWRSRRPAHRVPAALSASSGGGVSVLDWAVDLRDAQQVDRGVVLQKTS